MSFAGKPSTNKWKRCVSPFKSMTVRVIVLWTLSILFVIWLKINLHTYTPCSLQNNIPESDSESHLESKFVYQSTIEHVTFDSHSPLIFVGGTLKSGTTLMRALLDSHPLIRCSEETQIIKKLISMRLMWARTPDDSNRYIEAGIDSKLIDLSLSSFIVELMVKHGKAARNLCYKDTGLFEYAPIMRKLFPNAKFLLMIRDGRAVTHTLIKARIQTDPKATLGQWNQTVSAAYDLCLKFGSSTCLPVFYERLAMHPEETMRGVFKFIGIPYSERVLRHDRYVESRFTYTDESLKPINVDTLNVWFDRIPQDLLDDMKNLAPVLTTLGYDPNNNHPDYANM